MQITEQAGIPRILKFVNEDLQEVKKTITQSLSSDSNSINKLLGKFNVHNGKMIRPALVLLSGKCCGKVTKHHINVSAVIEMIHNATLLHDDVIDDGMKRRGSPTVNNLKGNEIAVLTGDFLLSRASKLCSELEPPVYKKVTDTIARVCEGELKQIAQKWNWQLSESEYIDIITDKTASLFARCCYLGAYLSGTDKKQIEALENFGLNTGIAFQITDDLLDLTGDEEKLGKTLGRDFEKKKITLPVIHLLRTIDKDRKKTLLESMNKASLSKKSLIDELLDLGSLEYAKKRSQEFIETAVSSLMVLKESYAQKILIETAGFVIDRIA